ncbi:MAG TPA: 2-keto-4-pentenoate hydratase, partial [Erythrobacter sp.]|nr:2-keto-4-pentenoate hydratase [Erythrobacter sp.]
MNSAAGDIAAAFVNARRNWKTLPEYPGERPSDLRSAYVIQDAALADWNRPIGGWKVGKINPPMSDELGANRLVGPVFADTVQREGQDSAQFPIFAGGFAAIEAEFMLRLAPQEGPLPATREAAMDWVDEVRIGLEVASSPYAAINVDGPCVTVSDHGNNAGLLLGASVDHTEWERLDNIAVSLEIDGREVGRASTATML